MLKEAIKFLLELKRPEIVQVNEKEYATLDLKPVYEAECKTINVSNLDSIIRYLLENPDKSTSTKIINIVSPIEITVESSLFGNFKQREKYIVADYSDLIPRIDFGRYLSIEEFIIMLKSKFIMTEDLEKIVKIVGNISDENITNYNDDGVTQQVTTKTGIARLGEVPLPPKVKLKPYRTFTEVEQPESEFLLRAKKDCGRIEFSLFEADGGAWKKEAIDNISKYLEEKLQNMENIIILN